MTPTYVCPKSKKPLFVNAKTDELVSEEGVAYPLIPIGMGIPNFLSAYAAQKSSHKIVALDLISSY